MTAYDLFLTSLRWLLGLSIGSTAGLLLGLVGMPVAGRRSWFNGLLDFCRAIPILALVPVVQMNIGINEVGKIGLIAWAVMFPMFISVRTARAGRSADLELMMSGARFSSRQRMQAYKLPRMMHGVVRGVEIGIGIAWLSVVAAESVGTYTNGFWSGGLGYRLIVGYDANNWGSVHSILLVFGALGVMSAWGWRLLLRFLSDDKLGFNPLHGLRDEV